MNEDEDYGEKSIGTLLQPAARGKFRPALRPFHGAGCGACYGGAGPCPQKDDAAGVIGKMVEADVIVMATPVYFYTLSAQMKTLIDRCCARYLEMKGKEFYFILTAAEESVPMMERTVECFRGLLDCLEDPREKGVVYGVGAWRAGDIEGMPAMDEAYAMGRGV